MGQLPFTSASYWGVKNGDEMNEAQEPQCAALSLSLFTREVSNWAMRSPSTFAKLRHTMPCATLRRKAFTPCQLAS